MPRVWAEGNRFLWLVTCVSCRATLLLRLEMNLNGDTKSVRRSPFKPKRYYLCVKRHVTSVYQMKLYK
jgi:hypothetical protein